MHRIPHTDSSYSACLGSQDSSERQQRRKGFSAGARSLGAQPVGAPQVTSEPKFGVSAGAIVQNGLLNFFSKVQDFLFGFLAMDLLGFWLPRGLNGLKEGRIPYSLENDPSMTEASGVERFTTSLKKNVEGLNWHNAAEELGREVLTGPGVLLMPVFVLLGFKSMSGSTAQELPYGELVRYKDSFKAFVHEHPLLDGKYIRRFQDPKEATVAFKKGLQEFVMERFADNKFLTETLGRKARHPVKGKGYLPANTPIKKYLELWSAEWADKVAEGFGPTRRKSSAGVYEELSAEFQDVLAEYNRKHVSQLSDKGKLKIQFLRKETGEKTLKMVGKQEAVGKFLSHLNLFGDFAAEVFHRVRDSKLEGFRSASESLYRQVTRRKLGITVVGTLTAAAYSFVLPRLVQRSGAYPATRLLNEGGAEDFVKKQAVEKHRAKYSHPPSSVQLVQLGKQVEEPFQVMPLEGSSTLSSVPLRGGLPRRVMPPQKLFTPVLSPALGQRTPLTSSYPYSPYSAAFAMPVSPSMTAPMMPRFAGDAAAESSADFKKREGVTYD